MTEKLVTYLPDIHRLLPSSPDAEKGVLSSFVLSPVEVHQICTESGLSDAHFHIPNHAILYRLFTGMALAGKPLDFVTIADEVRSLGVMDAIGVGYLSELYTFLPTAANVAFYIESVKSKFTAREIIRVGTEMAARAYEPTEEPEKLAGEANAAFSGMLQKKSKRKSVNETMNEIITEVRNGEDEKGKIATGIEEIDEKLTLYLGDLLIITAPTSCGKTALALQVMNHIALQGHRVGFYGLEMTTKRLLSRSIAQMGGNNTGFVRMVVKNAANPPSSYSLGVIQEFRTAAEMVNKFKQHIRDDLSRLEEIIADIRAEHAREKFTFIVADYLQLIRVDGKERRQLEIAEITQRLKALANELEIIICLPSQVNKAGGTREAEDAENDASALLKITSKEDSNGNPSPDKISVWKQREGPRHVQILLEFDDRITRFVSVGKK